MTRHSRDDQTERMERADRTERTERDDAWIAVVAEHTEWGERTPSERAALRARVEEQTARPARWGAGTALGAAAAAAVALALWILPGGLEPTDDSLGRGFLSAAYYGSDGAAESDASYLPQDFQYWADALDESIEGELTTSS